MHNFRPFGYDNELCTVTLGNHEFCQTTVVLPGKGEIETNWLWTGGARKFKARVNEATSFHRPAQDQMRTAAVTEPPAP